MCQEGTHSDEATASADNGTIMVTNALLPAGTSTHMLDKDTGDQVRVFVPRADVVSESLLRAMAQYPTHAVNGMDTLRAVTDRATKKVVMQPEPSFLVVIPRTQVDTRWGTLAGGGNARLYRPIRVGLSRIAELDGYDDFPTLPRRPTTTSLRFAGCARSGTIIEMSFFPVGPGIHSTARRPAVSGDLDGPLRPAALC